MRNKRLGKVAHIREHGSSMGTLGNGTSVDFGVDSQVGGVASGEWCRWDELIHRSGEGSEIRKRCCHGRR